jgi:WD40 repeat protein
MQIRVLGSVDVELEGSRVKLAGPKQRAVLSMLALSANTTVSFERLVDGLWGEEPVTFSPDGRLLAVAAMYKGVEVRDPRSGRLIARLRTDELARSAAFSPDGRLLFVGLLNGAGQFYATRDWRPVGDRIRGQDQRLLNALFSPDGRTLATSSADGTVMLWDVATRKPIGSRVPVERNSYVAAVMSGDGAHLFALSAGTEGIRLTLSPSIWKQQACAIAGRELTTREWADALPGRGYRRVCG